MAELIKLRDLPGVQRLEEVCRAPDSFDHLKRAYTMDEIDFVSIGLFSIGYPETVWEAYEDEAGEERAEREEYEAQFRNVLRPYAETEPFWHALGWDITNGAGKELDCAVWLCRQIIAVEAEAVEGARLTPDGSGTLAMSDDDEQPDRWGAAMQKSAEEFVKGRSG